MRPINKANLYLSSRTDTGVHAFSNTGTVDLAHPATPNANPETTTAAFFDPGTITAQLNYYFVKRKLDVRINRTLAVHPEFRARQAYMQNVGVSVIKSQSTFVFAFIHVSDFVAQS